MKFLTSFILIIMATLVVGCSNTGTENQVSIELNKGQKWEVNEEMSPFILAGEKILSDYSGQDYVALAQQLESENAKLIKSCTMKGVAHDELHKWLHPHMQLISSLGEAENLDQANSLISELKSSFGMYHRYFQ